MLNSRMLLTVAGAMVFFLVQPTATARADGARFTESYAEPGDAKTVVAVFDSASKGEYVLRSRDGGKSWQKMATPAGTAVRRLGPQDVADFFVDVGAHVEITLAGGNALSRAGSDGRWTKLSDPGAWIEKLVPTGSVNRFFAVTQTEEREKSGFVNTDGKSGLSRTDDGGRTWTNVAVLPFNCALSPCEMAASPGGERLVEGTGYISGDGGKTWKRLSFEAAGREIADLQRSRARHAIQGTPAEVAAALRAVRAPMGRP